MKNISSLLDIKKKEDIKTFDIKSIFEDDHLQCAECNINGIDIEFLWYDNIGFIEYWDESERAFNDLIEAIKHSVSMAECEEELEAKR